MPFDLIIIGGGMSGISVGHFFRDQNILILEKGNLLSEASGKNAGFVVSGFGEHFNRTAARWGLDRAQEIQTIHLSNHKRIRELGLHLDCDYNLSGSLTIALNEKEQNDLLQSFEEMAGAGYEVEWLEHASSGLKEDRGALLNRHDGSIDPVKFWSHVAKGLPTETQCDVRTVRQERDFVCVETTKGIFKSERVVFCLNAFAAELVPQLKGRYIPLRGQIVELPLRKSRPTDRPVLMQYGEIYWRFTEHHLIFGGLENTVPEDEIGIAKEVSFQIQEEQLRWIREYLEEDLLDFSNEQFQSRCSTMAFTVDGFPFVGALPQKNRYVLSGLCGLGHGYTMECASWLYELIVLGRNRIPSYISSDRINTLPVYEGGNWRNLYEAWNH
jgi:gamma-glutamylputrescine oxidase